MPETLAEGRSIEALLSETTASILKALLILNGGARPTQAENDAEVRFWMNSIPTAEVSWKISLVTSRGKKLFFIPRGQKTDRLVHVVSMKFNAVPGPPDPLDQTTPADTEPLPLVLLEPAYLVDDEESDRVCNLLVAALRNQRWRARTRDPIDRKQVEKAADRISDALGSFEGDHPERGLIVFRLADRPGPWLVVNLTKDEDNDGLFLLHDGVPQTAEIFNIAGDKNEKIMYFPLHLLVVAIRQWLARGETRRTELEGGLPARWGIGALDNIARGLLQGYLEAHRLLAEQPAAAPLAVCYDFKDVQAEIGFSVSQRQLDIQMNFVAPADPGSNDDLVTGRVLLRILRGAGTARLSVALVAPGFILVGDMLSAFLKQAQAAATEIATNFTPDPVLETEYEKWIASPEKPKEIVVFVSARDKNDDFRYLAVWPAIRNGQSRDFVFSCTSGDHGLEDIAAVVSVDDDIQSTLIDTPENEGGLSDEQYSHFSRFFRAARIWKAGFAGTGS